MQKIYVNTIIFVKYVRTDFYILNYVNKLQNVVIDKIQLKCKCEVYTIDRILVHNERK